MSKQKFNVGDKVKILDPDSRLRWAWQLTVGLPETIGKTGVVVPHDKFCEDYLVMIEDVGIEFWYREDDLELVQAAVVTNDTINVQTCIDFLLSNGYKVTLEKL